MDDLDGANSRGVALFVEPPLVEMGKHVPFAEKDEYKAILLFGVFSRGSANVLENEYCKGLLLLRMQFGEINFLRDAFMCFYRVLEHFATHRVLGVPRLQNELKQLQFCLRSLGFGDALVAEMKELYTIRSSQTAHAQLMQKRITGDDVLKLKVFVDALLHKTLLLEANGLMEKKFGPPRGSWA